MSEIICKGPTKTDDEVPTADAVEALGERIALLAAQISAATSSC